MTRLEPTCTSMDSSEIRCWLENLDRRYRYAVHYNKNIVMGKRRVGEMWYPHRSSANLEFYNGNDIVGLLVIFPDNKNTIYSIKQDWIKHGLLPREKEGWYEIPCEQQSTEGTVEWSTSRLESGGLYDECSGVRFLYLPPLLEG